jgi:hypothetical protein
MSNLVSGTPTWGFWEYFLYCDDTLSSILNYVSNDIGTGLGMGILLTSLISKSIFVPSSVYS